MHPAVRQKTRKLIVQALYQWAMSDATLSQLCEQYIADGNPKKVDVEYFKQCVTGVMNDVKAVDDIIEPVLDRPFDQLDPIEFSVLRLSVYELLHCLDVPYKVVINEGVRMAKMFGGTDSYKFVNAVLDKLARQLRAAEIKG